MRPPKILLQRLFKNAWTQNTWVKKWCGNKYLKMLMTIYVLHRPPSTVKAKRQRRLYCTEGQVVHHTAKSTNDDWLAHFGKKFLSSPLQQIRRSLRLSFKGNCIFISDRCWICTRSNISDIPWSVYSSKGVLDFGWSLCWSPTPTLFRKYTHRSRQRTYSSSSHHDVAHVFPTRGNISEPMMKHTIVLSGVGIDQIHAILQTREK